MNQELTSTINQSELSHLRHELRTPINAIIGYSEMLMEDFTDEELSTNELEKIQSQGNELLSRVNRILEPITSSLNYCSLDSQEILETSSSIQDVVTNCEQLLVDVDDEDYQQDISKIKTSAHNLQNLLTELLNSCLQIQSIDFVNYELMFLFC